MSGTLGKSLKAASERLVQLMNHYHIQMVPEAYSQEFWFQEDIRLIKLQGKSYSERAYQATYNLTQIMQVILTRLEQTWVITGNKQVDFLLEKLTNEFAHNASALLCDETTPYSYHIEGIFLDPNNKAMETVKESLRGFNEIMKQLANANGDTRTVNVINLLSLMKTLSNMLIVPVYDEKTYALNKLLAQFFHQLAEDNDLMDVFKTPFMKALFVISEEFDLNNLHSPLKNMLAMLKSLAYALDEARENAVLPEGKKTAEILPDAEVLNIVERDHVSEEIENYGENIEEISTLRSDYELMRARNQIQFELLDIQYNLDKLTNLLMAEKLWVSKINNPYLRVTRAEKLMNLLLGSLPKAGLSVVEAYMRGETGYLPDNVKLQIENYIQSEKENLSRKLGVANVDDIEALELHIKRKMTNLTAKIKYADKLLNVRSNVSYDFSTQFNEIKKQQVFVEQHAYFFEKRNKNGINYKDTINEMLLLSDLVANEMPKAKTVTYSLRVIRPFLPEHIQQSIDESPHFSSVSDSFEVNTSSQVYRQINAGLKAALYRNIFYVQRYLQEYNEVIMAQSFLEWRQSNKKLYLRDPSFITEMLAGPITQDLDEIKRYISGESDNISPQLLERLNLYFNRLKSKYESDLGGYNVSGLIELLESESVQPFVDGLIDKEANVGLDLETPFVMKSINSLVDYQNHNRIVGWAKYVKRAVYAFVRPGYEAAQAILPIKWQQNIAKQELSKEALITKQKQFQSACKIIKRVNSLPYARYQRESEVQALGMMMERYWQLLLAEQLIIEKTKNPRYIFKDPKQFDDILFMTGIHSRLTESRDLKELHEFSRVARYRLPADLQEYVLSQIKHRKEEITSLFGNDELKQAFDLVSNSEHVSREQREKARDLKMLLRYHRVEYLDPEEGVAFDKDDFELNESNFSNVALREMVNPIASPQLTYYRLFDPSFELKSKDVPQTPLLQLTQQLAKSMEVLCETSGVTTLKDYTERDKLIGSQRVLAAGHNIARLLEQAVMNINRVQQVDTSKVWEADPDAIHLMDTLDNLARISNSLIAQITGLVNRDGHAYTKKTYQTLIDNDYLVIKELKKTVDSLTVFIDSARELIQLNDPRAIKNLPLDKLLYSIRVVFELGLVSVDDEQKYQMLRLYQDYFQAVSQIDLEKGLKTDGYAVNKAVSWFNWAPNWYKTGFKYLVKYGELDLSRFLEKILLDPWSSFEYVKYLQQVAGVIAEGMRDSIPDMTISDSAVQSVESNRKAFNRIIRTYGGKTIEAPTAQPRSYSDEKHILDNPLSIEENSVRDSLVKTLSVNFETVSLTALRNYYNRIKKERARINRTHPLDSQTGRTTHDILEVLDGCLLSLKDLINYESTSGNGINLSKRQHVREEYEKIKMAFPIKAIDFEAEVLKNHLESLYALQGRFNTLVTQAEQLSQQHLLLTYALVHIRGLDSAGDEASDNSKEVTLALDCFNKVLDLDPETLRLVESHPEFVRKNRTLVLQTNSELYKRLKRELNAKKGALEARDEEILTARREVFHKLGYDSIPALCDIQSKLNININDARSANKKNYWIYTLFKIVTVFAEFITKIINRIFRTRFRLNPLQNTSYVDVPTTKSIGMLQHIEEKQKEVSLDYEFRNYLTPQAKKKSTSESTSSPSEPKQSELASESEAHATEEANEAKVPKFIVSGHLWLNGVAIQMQKRLLEKSALTRSTIDPEVQASIEDKSQDEPKVETVKHAEDNVTVEVHLEEPSVGTAQHSFWKEKAKSQVTEPTVTVEEEFTPPREAFIKA